LTVLDIRQATLSLFTIGLLLKHMLKKYADRVKATYEYMRSLILWMQITRKSNKCVCKMKNNAPKILSHQMGNWHY
jgi:hypothetical protein